MNLTVILAILIIGFAAGLRSLTAPAVVAWAAHLSLIDLHSTPLAFIGSPIAAGVLTLLALVEYVADQLPNTPARTAAPGLSARVVTGTFCGACFAAAAGTWLVFGLLGGVAAIAGAFAGFQLRTRLVKKLAVKDIMIAIPEDLFAIGLAALSVYIVSR
jgi:uncharacterized membrane protein